MTAATADRKNWREAFRAMQSLFADPNDTVQVFRVMVALNGGSSARNYRRLLDTPAGGRVAYRRVELLEKLMNRNFLAQFGPGTVGAAYRNFIDATGYSAAGLAAVDREVKHKHEDEHPYAWFGRRERDLHDVWHVLTGYEADDPLGELCLVAFSFAQSNGLGWAFIATMGALKSLSKPHGTSIVRAVWEGYRHGCAAHWLHLEDIESLFAEPLDGVRARLNIARPVAYENAKREADIPVPTSWLATSA